MRARIMLVLILCIAFLLRWWAVHLDPFLHDWDERFHALVARNMMDHPFLPRLRPMSLLPYDFKAWCCNEIWVHKQPLFLWQMALSMKIFGVSEITLRYPSLIMGTLMVPMIYQLGKWFSSGDKRVGMIAALFQACSYLQLELTSGYKGMDHNDVAMGFYTLASFWAFSHYTEAKNKKALIWAALVGVLAGAAILNKWLTGLLIFGGWAVYIIVRHLQRSPDRNLRIEVAHFIFALGCCAIIFLPWQIYISHAFPVEAAYEFDFNNRHVTEIIEGHGGDIDFFWSHFPDYFGPFVWMMLPVSFFFFLRKNVIERPNPAQIALMSSLLAVFIFFSFIAATKIESHFMFVAPLGLILMAALWVEASKGMRYAAVFLVLASCLTAFLQLQHVRILKTHDPAHEYWQAKASNTRIYKILPKLLAPGTRVILNTPGLQDVEVMFYNKGILAHHWVPSEADMQEIFRQDLKVAYFPGRPGFELPSYLLKYRNAYPLPVVPR